jgi:branched-chain amino acid transport system ATP-binding protein
MMLAPHVILSAEPTVGLSATLAGVVLPDRARSLADRGTAVLLVEQKAHAAPEIADCPCVLVHGRGAMWAPGRQRVDDPDMGEILLGGGSSPQHGPPAAR